MLFADELAPRAGSPADALGQSLETYGPGAIAHYMSAELAEAGGPLAIPKILGSISDLARGQEEGARPSGRIVFLAPEDARKLPLDVAFAADDLPRSDSAKLCGKLMRIVATRDAFLLSDGSVVLGVSSAQIPERSVLVELNRGQGEVWLKGQRVCSIQDGYFHSWRLALNVGPIEEALRGMGLAPEDVKKLATTILQIASSARERRHGCSIVMDLRKRPGKLAGQVLERPLDLFEKNNVALACGMAGIDGCLQVDADARLLAFGCLLDGAAVPGREDRSRGARYNSAIRFTDQNRRTLAIVVSEDGPLSIVSAGRDHGRLRAVDQPASVELKPPTLKEWLGQ